MPHRRRQTLAAGAAALLLAGCGFELRRTPVLPFSRIRLAGFRADSPMGEALRRALAPQTGVVTADAPTDVVLTALEDTRERTVAASTATGQVRELRLRLRLRFRLDRAGGAPLLAPAEIEQVRDMSFTESAALAKEQEEALLLRDMQDDIVAQVLRMLASAQAGPKPL
jgi:LPS-assembly lipoprotein